MGAHGMYLTPEAERCLLGAESRLFVQSLGMIVDQLSLHNFDYGITVFDQLQHGQKIVILESMASALLCEDVPPVPLTAAIEGAVAVVYRFIRESLRGELGCDGYSVADFEDDDETDEDEDGTPQPSWRQLILAACEETGWDDDLPPSDSTDLDEWESLVKHLADRILWDEDWDYADHYLDLAPEIASTVKSTMGIAADYFVAAPREPLGTELPALISRLQKLTRSIRYQSGPDAP
jgi:hypothetical protein